MDPFTLMLSGNILGAITAAFTNLLGGWFYAAILFVVVAAVYLRSNDLGITSFVMLIVGVSMTALMPDVQQVYNLIAIIIIMVLTIVMFKLFGKI